MTEIPSWITAAGAAILGFVGAWAALKATVAGLKCDVDQLKNLLLIVNTLQARYEAMNSELDRLRLSTHSNRNDLQKLDTRLAVVEHFYDSQPPNHKEDV